MRLPAALPVTLVSALAALLMVVAAAAGLTAASAQAAEAPRASQTAVQAAVQAARQPAPAVQAGLALNAAAAAEDCFGPDIRCDLVDGAVDTTLDGVTSVLGVGVDAATSVPGVAGMPNPFSAVGNAAAKVAADAWTGMMLALWQAGLYVLQVVLAFGDYFLTPDLRANGPGKDAYKYTFWMAGALMLIMAMIQLGIAAFKREGKGLAKVAIGTGQFVIVWSTWLGYCVAVVAACRELTKALMKALLGVDTWKGWEPLAGIKAEDVASATVATVLGLLGLVLWLAALGHLLIMLARGASLIVLVATGPIAAAGLVSDAGRSWFWKSLRWFHAAAFTPVLMVLVLGIGVKMSTGVAAGLADSTQKAIGTALPSVMLVYIAAVAPLALFKMLAFVDPGTPSGASFRQGLALQGGLQNLLGGGSGGGSSAASKSDGNGQAAGESSAEGTTGDRFSKSTQGMLSNLPAIGQAASAGLGMVQSLGAKGGSLLADETNQAGVGHQTYGPDFSNIRSGGSSSMGWPPNAKANAGDADDRDQSGDQSGDQGGALGGNQLPTPPAMPQPGVPTGNQSPPSPAAGQNGSHSSSGQSSPGNGAKPTAGAPSAGAGGAGGAGATPPPVV